jgi:predicted ATPase/serine phosphatase RsbU (regulator of sigma subunit)/tRNA A-37 threonylcarbamoyl transferase component Bud32
MIDLPGYAILEKLHDGANSLVFRAVRVRDRQSVVVKSLKNVPANSVEMVRLNHESEMIKRVSAENVIRVWGIERGNDTNALVVEDFGGVSIRKVLASSRIDVETTLRWACQIVEGVAKIHECNILHKDINTSNIVVNVETGKAKIIDFGISSLLTRESPRPSTPNLLEGTLQYISPEQTGRMNHGVDYRTDFYSFGITLYEMLIGWPPFQSDDPLELIHSHMARIPLPPHGINREIPEMLSAIVMKLLAKAPEERYQSATGLKADLQRCLEEWQRDRRVGRFDLGSVDVSNRLHLPEKLYGRKADIELLLETVERVRHGRAELLVITGFAGIGKSSLVHEVHKPVVEHRGIFVSGKFEQFKYNVPYACIAQAIQDLVRNLLALNEAELRNWKERFLAALGTNGQVIVNIIPELELILGKQPALHPLPPVETQNRFHDTFQNFLRVCASADHPLVIFLDDLQWADLASLKLIEVLMANPENKYLLLIGALREEEVRQGDPLFATIQDMQRAGIPVNRITIQPLNVRQVNEFIADALHQDPEETELLASLVHQKTGGNPFFTGEFLKSLYQEGTLVLDAEKQSWEWDLDILRTREITDNVVTLMTGKIRRLAAATQKAVTAAACIGVRFDLATLAAAMGQTEGQTAVDVWEAVEEGLVFPVTEAYKFVRQTEDTEVRQHLPADLVVATYKFSHDRVRQAALELLTDEEETRFHQRIGRALLERMQKAPSDELLFDVVNHLMVAAGLIVDEHERDQLAQLTCRAGLRAKASTAVAAALRYFSTGCELLGSGSWKRRYELSYTLHLERAEGEGLIGNFTRAEELFDALIPYAGSDVDKAKVYSRKSAMYVHASELDKSLAAAVAGLKLAGISLNPKSGTLRVAVELLKSRWYLRRVGFQSLESLPRMTDGRSLIAMELLMVLSRYAYETSKEFHGTISTIMINLTLSRGLTNASSFAFGVYGIIVAVGLRKLDEAFAWTKLATRVAEQFEDAQMIGRSNFSMAAVHNHWHHPIHTNFPLLDLAVRQLTESGDVEFATYACMHILSDMFFSGRPLNEFLDRANQFLEAARRRKFDDDAKAFMMDRQLALCLRGETNSPATFETPDFHESGFLENLSLLRVSDFWIAKLQAHTILGTFDEALEAIEKLTPIAHTLTRQPMEAEFAFYASLTYASVMFRVDGGRRKTYRKAMRNNLAKLRLWSSRCPENFEALALFVEAELAGVNNNVPGALALIEKAMLAARKQGFQHIEGLAHERAARFHIRLSGKPQVADELAEAVRGFTRWGAQGKVRLLQREFPEFVTVGSPQTRTSGTMETASTGTATTSLDLTSVLKASQALSGEIQFDRLLDSMMQIILENAGAQRGVVLLERSGEFKIEAEGNAQDKSVTVLPSIPVEGTERLSDAIVRYVARTKEYLVLNDASREGAFTDDPYIRRVKAKSILCAPILHQTRMTGIVFLENNLTVGAFTPQRLEILRLLSAQIAISIENALLHEKEKAFVRMQEEIRLASQIQQNLLPVASPSIAGYEVAGVNVPAEMVGGDYFDFIPIHENRWAICLGDVSGKGLPASLLMANLQATLRGQTMLDIPPHECLARSNRLLFQSTSPEKFATLFYGILDAGTHRFSFSNAGHDHPHLLKGEQKEIRLKAGGIPLGMLQEYRYDEEAVTLEPGDIIVMCSDGIAEAMDAHEDFFGEDRLTALLRQIQHLPPQDLVENIRNAVNAFVGSTPQSDDITIVALKRLKG